MHCVENINVNMILTSKSKHFEERQVEYPSYSTYHAARMNICINKERSRQQTSTAIGTSLGQKVISPKRNIT
jgi:hypothetical protein